MKEIICAGFAGQGVLTIGMLLVHAGIKQNKQVLFYPSYGSEVRGGTASCVVKISDKQIASPVCKKADIVIGMNVPAVDKFEPFLKLGGVLFVNSSLIPDDRVYRDDIKVIKVPVTDIAAEAENPRGANIVMLGVLAGKTDLFKPESLKAMIHPFFKDAGKEEHVAKNVACFERGVQEYQHRRN